MVVGAAYTGMGNPRPSVLMSLSRMVVLYVPLAFLGAWLLGPLGVFAAGSISNLLVGAGAMVFVTARAREAVSAGHISPNDMRFRLKTL